MSGNGKRRPPRPRIEIVSSTRSESEAAAIVAALERFLVETAPAPEPSAAPTSRWQAAALADAVAAHQLAGRGWDPRTGWN